MIVFIVAGIVIRVRIEAAQITACNKGDNDSIGTRDLVVLCCSCVLLSNKLLGE